MDLPMYIPSNKKGRNGLNILTKIVENELGWIVRPNHQEDDFGIDAYIDIVIDGFVTGKSIALQLKSGQSYLKEINSDFWIFYGEKKHLNFFLNHDNPVLVVLVDLDLEIAYWEICEIENVNLLSKNWSMPIPKKQQISLKQKEELLRYVSKGVDYVSQLEDYWRGNKLLSDSARICIFASIDNVQQGNYQPLIELINKICSNKLHLSQFRENIEIGIHGYDYDKRELYEIPEVKNWIKNIFENVPGLTYFLKNDKHCQFLKVFRYSSVGTLSIDKKSKKNKILVEFDSKDLTRIFEILFSDLNNFTESFDISDEINEQISRNITKCIIGEDAYNNRA